MRMGVPIAPRNIFPSNIQGLPTWYEVRVSAEGRLGARGGADFVVAMNPQTFAQDVAGIESGGYLFYDSSRPIRPDQLRDDIVVLAVPLTEIAAKRYADLRTRQLLKNIIYLGALAALLDIELGVLETLIASQFKGKDKLIAANVAALHVGHAEANARFTCPLPLRVERMDGVKDRVLVEGNFAAGLGAVYGGATVCAWYPITPSTSLAESFEANPANSASTRPRARRNTRSCRPRTRSPPSASRSAPAGTARARSPRPRGRAFRWGFCPAASSHSIREGSVAGRRILRVEGGQFEVAVEAPYAKEKHLHRAIAEHPEVLPSEDLDLGPLITVAVELDLGAGPIDLITVDPRGRLAIVEFKKGTENPDVRKVVAQVLDYGSSLWRLSYEELERRPGEALRPSGEGRWSSTPTRCSLGSVSRGSMPQRSSTAWWQRSRTAASRSSTSGATSMTALVGS